MPWRRKIILVLVRDRTSVVQFVSQLWAGIISLRHGIHTGSEVYPVFSPMDTGGTFLRRNEIGL
jgi:hypothetical protein